MVTSKMDTLVETWQEYLKTADWQVLIKGVEPKQTDCGPVYELDNPLERPNESLAIADMRGIALAGPHYHTGGESEIYFVLEGEGTTVIGGEEITLKPLDHVATPPDTAHFTISHGLVLAVVNTPPFEAANYVALTSSDPSVGFDQGQLDRLNT